MGIAEIFQSNIHSGEHAAALANVIRNFNIVNVYTLYTLMRT